MNTYLVLKTTGKGSKQGRSAVVIDLQDKRRKSKRVVGNIPELFHGMFIELELEGNVAVDYELSITGKNVEALEKAGINPAEYKAILDRHTILKKDGVAWNTAKLGLDEIYSVLPFGEADKVHKEMLNNANEPTRVEAINKKIIDKARQRRKITYGIEEYLGYFDSVEQEGAYQQLMVNLKMMCLTASRYGISDCKIWDNEMKSKEDFVRENIQKRKKLEYQLLTKKEIQTFLDTVKDSGLANEQLATLWALKDSNPCVITGGAGTGKTTVIKTLIDCYAMHYSRNHILLIAPTGKASRRLAKKTGLPAATIHRALRKTPDDDFVFYNENNPLPYRLVIVDESSMIDTALMYDLLSAMEVNCKIIFVGDHNQLYPVGYGEPFFDFLSELPVFRLAMNHRQAEGTDILDRANKALENAPIESGRGVKVDKICFEDIGEIILTNNKDTQIMSPYNALNSQINDYLRKDEDNFNIGDKVMTTANTKSYCNGDIGYVEKIDGKGSIWVRLEEENRLVEIAPSHYKDLSLAYAITVHKMQGSEQKRIIMFVPLGDTLIESRMMYTAITRARNELELYYFTPSEQ